MTFGAANIQLFPQPPNFSGENLKKLKIED
jgi:hypothetical protein